MTEFIKSFEEVDTAMFHLFSNILIKGKKVKLIYYTPDIDLEEAEAPSIVLFRTNPFLDVSRWDNNGQFIDNPVYDADGNVTHRDVRTPPEPWSILYSVKILYEQQLHGVHMNDQILRLFPRGSYITIKGVDYDVEQTSAGLWGTQYKDFGKVEDGKRRFQETYTYRVDILLEIGESRSVPTVREVIPREFLLDSVEMMKGGTNNGTS